MLVKKKSIILFICILKVKLFQVIILEGGRGYTVIKYVMKSEISNMVVLL